MSILVRRYPDLAIAFSRSCRDARARAPALDRAENKKSAACGQRDGDDDAGEEAIG